MFWSGNYTLGSLGKDLKSLLKEENVTLTQVLEASEILTECTANNTALIQYLTRPDILSELITMITEEPPKELDKQLQYRYSNIACEVLTSHVATLKDKLSSDAGLMNRLCDFLDREPPLNPLLASYFSRMVETLLAKSFKEDWCLYNIVCLRVLDRFRARRGFLPALLRHLPTSAAADTVLVLLRQEDALHDVIMQWLEEHNFVETLVRIVCGTHEELGAAMLDNDTRRNNDADNNSLGDKELISARHAIRGRLAASDNAVRLLCELLEEPLGDNNTQIRASVLALLQAPTTLDVLLQGMFSAAPEHMRLRALVNGGKLLQALLNTNDNAAVERALAPHLPLLHQTLLRGHCLRLPDGAVRPALGAHRLQLARLVAALVASKEDTVATALVALGTVGTLLELWWEFPDNSFLQSAAATAIKDAVDNRDYSELYWTHLFYECDIATKILDAFENEQRKNKLGHMWSLLFFFNCIELPKPALERYDSLLPSLGPTIDRLDSPLGGYYPSQKNFEEGESGGTARYFNSAELQEFQEIIKNMPQIERENDPEEAEDDDEDADDKQYDNSAVDDVLRVSPWLNEDAIEETEAKGWARWNDVFPTEQDDRHLAAISADRELQAEFAADRDDFEPFWSYNATDGAAVERSPYTKLANNLLTVMREMTPDFIADIVQTEPPVDGQHTTTTHDQKTEEQSTGEKQYSTVEQQQSVRVQWRSSEEEQQPMKEQQQPDGEQRQHTIREKQSIEQQRSTGDQQQSTVGKKQQSTGGELLSAVEKQQSIREEQTTVEQQKLIKDQRHQSIGDKQQLIEEQQQSVKEQQQSIDEQQQSQAIDVQQQSIDGQQQPMHGQQQSIDGQQQSIDGQQQSIDGQQQSIHGQQAINRQQQSKDGQQQSIDGQQQSIHGQQQSIHGQQQPIHGQQQSIDGQQQSIDGQQQQSIHGQQQPIHGQQQSIDGQQQQSIDGQQQQTIDEQQPIHGQQQSIVGQQQQTIDGKQQQSIDGQQQQSIDRQQQQQQSIDRQQQQTIDEQQQPTHGQQQSIVGQQQQTIDGKQQQSIDGQQQQSIDRQQQQTIDEQQQPIHGQQQQSIDGQQQQTIDEQQQPIHGQQQSIVGQQQQTIDGQQQQTIDEQSPIDAR